MCNTIFYAVMCHTWLNYCAMYNAYPKILQCAIRVLALQCAIRAALQCAMWAPLLTLQSFPSWGSREARPSDAFFSVRYQGEIKNKKMLTCEVGRGLHCDLHKHTKICKCVFASVESSHKELSKQVR